MKTAEDALRIKIAGGLGNQLFMYFGGLKVAEHLQKRPMFELSALAEIRDLHPGMNIHDLGILNQDQIITNSFISKTPNLSKNVLLRKIANKIKREIFDTHSEKVFRPKEIGYVDPNLVSKKVTDIDAYFQSWRYFSIDNDRRFILDAMERKISPWVNLLSQEIDNKDILVLHVRRGDLLQPQNRWLGILSKDYYFEITSQHPEKQVWIFTDSPEEVKKEFIRQDKEIRVITPPLNSDPIDSLVLMSRARTLAISNSTFSWWSAILSGPNSNVYAPEKWFQQRSNPIDLIPQNWTKIPSKWEAR